MTPLNNIAAFVIGNLPDSISERRSLLQDLLSLLPAKHPLRARVATMLLFLNEHEAHQLHLPIEFKNL